MLRNHCREFQTLWQDNKKKVPFIPVYHKSPERCFSAEAVLPTRSIWKFAKMFLGILVIRTRLFIHLLEWRARDVKPPTMRRAAVTMKKYRHASLTT